MLFPDQCSIVACLQGAKWKQVARQNQDACQKNVPEDNSLRRAFPDSVLILPSQQT